MQKINEKPQVVNEYEAGKAIPNQQIIAKLERAVGVYQFNHKSFCLYFFLFLYFRCPIARQRYWNTIWKIKMTVHKNQNDIL